MSDTDLHIALMEAGRMNLMHLPPGAIAWLWDRPVKQVDAAESLAVAANAYGNPVVDASLLKADQNIMLIKCEGGECFRIYPDGGYSYDDTPMDIGGCSSVLQGSSSEDCGCPMDDMGHGMEPEPEMEPPMDMMEPSIGGGMDMPAVEDETGLAGTAGMGTGSPYVGDMDLDNLVSSRQLGEFRIRDLPKEEVDMMAASLGLLEWGDDDYYDRYEHDDRGATPPEQVYVEVYDDSTDDYKEVAINVSWDIQPTEYEGPYVFAQGGAVLQDMQLASPVQVNGKVFNRINNELAALIMATILQDEVEPTPKAYEALMQHIEEKEGADIDVPSQRYPDSRAY